LAEACIFAYQACDASAYLALFSREADYVGFAGQDYARISELKDELAACCGERDFGSRFTRTGCPTISNPQPCRHGQRQRQAG
jgi:hypothetical protein